MMYRDDSTGCGQRHAGATQYWGHFTEQWKVVSRERSGFLIDAAMGFGVCGRTYTISGHNAQVGMQVSAPSMARF